MRPTKKNEEDKTKKICGEKNETNTCGGVECFSSNNSENNKEKKASEEKKEKKTGGGVSIFLRTQQKLLTLAKPLKLKA